MTDSTINQLPDLTNDGLNIGDSVYSVSASLFVNKYTFEVDSEQSSVEMDEYILSDKYEDEFGKHEVFELLPDRKEKIITGWENSDDGESFVDNLDVESFVANTVEVKSYVEDFYGEGDFIAYLFSFNSTDRERAKTEVCKKISSIIKQIVIMGSKLGEIVDNLKDM